MTTPAHTKKMRDEAIRDLKEIAGKIVTGTYEEVLDAWITEFRENEQFRNVIRKATSELPLEASVVMLRIKPRKRIGG